MHKVISDLPVDTTLIHGHGDLATVNEASSPSSEHNALNSSEDPSPIDLSTNPHGASTNSSPPLLPAIRNITVPYFDIGILQNNVEPVVNPGLVQAEQYVGYIGRCWSHRSWKMRKGSVRQRNRIQHRLPLPDLHPQRQPPYRDQSATAAACITPALTLTLLTAKSQEITGSVAAA